MTFDEIVSYRVSDGGAVYRLPRLKQGEQVMVIKDNWPHARSVTVVRSQDRTQAGVTPAGSTEVITVPRIYLARDDGGRRV